MIWPVWLAAIGALCCLIASGVSARPAAPSGQPAAVVIGDSHGEGVASASGLTRLARISVHIRGPKALRQIAAAPVGSTAFVVLGSNDAEGEIRNLDRSIDAIVHAAENKNMRLVWLGPPCARRAWNGRSVALDRMLKARFANTSVTYVSMHDDTICSGRFFEPDGVHFTMKGYAYMWEKARRAAGFGSAHDPIVVAIKTTDRPGATVAGETETVERSAALKLSVPAATSRQARPAPRERSPQRVRLTRPATVFDDRLYPSKN